MQASIEEGNPVIAGHCHPDRKLHVCFQLSHLCEFVYTESMTVTVVDEYTESRASFGLVHSKYHGNFLIHFLDKVRSSYIQCHLIHYSVHMFIW